MKKYPWYKIGRLCWLCTLWLCAQTAAVSPVEHTIVLEPVR